MSHRGGGGGRGRGEYYKQKYGGGGRGRGGGGGGGGGYGGGRGDGAPRPASPERMEGSGSGPARSGSELHGLLRRIDGAGYGAYRDMEGAFDFNSGPPLPFRLCIDRVQSDPFAPPSRMRALIAGSVAGFPKESYSTPIRRVALADFLSRAFVHAAQDAGDDQRTESGGWSGKKGGEITMESPSQHVLSRSSILVDPSDGSIEARFTVALPARGRSIEGTWAARILLERLPALLHKALLFASLDAQRLRNHVLSVEDQEALRAMLPQAGAVGFVRNGALLPRMGGHSDRPMDASQAVPFQSPPNLEREVRLPNVGAVRGMLIPKGISVIVGGGFHGKSTLLQALEVGVYNHVPGDGREFVCVDPSAVKIRAEDGRCVTQVNISPFIDNLPFKKDTRAFMTQDASGSTSQAANIIEALEVGCGVLLMDEDTSATNFLIRDLRMQMLVSREQEPITPFISKVRALYTQLHVSTIMVIGGSGDYFDVADHVIAMDHYLPSDRTAEARAISERFASGSNGHLGVVQIDDFGSRSTRYPIGASLQCSGKVVARGREKLSYGDHEIDLSSVEQLVELGQTRAIGAALRLLGSRIGSGVATKGVRELTEELESLMDGPQGLDALEPSMRLGTMARPRRFEIAAALGRFRTLQATSKITAT